MNTKKESHEYLAAEAGEHVTDGGQCWCRPKVIKLLDDSLLYIHHRRDKSEMKELDS